MYRAERDESDARDRLVESEMSMSYLTQPDHADHFVHQVSSNWYHQLIPQSANFADDDTYRLAALE
jgi:hypothetical protein